MEDIVKYFIIAVCAIVAIIQILQRGSISKGVSKIMTFEERQLQNKERKGQTFSEFVPVYKYNEKTGLVEEDGEENIQARIDSALDTSLDVFLQRFSAEEKREDIAPEVQVASNSLESAYDSMLRASQVAEAYAKEHKMTGASLLEIMRAINNDYKAKSKVEPTKVAEDEKNKTVESEKQA